VRSWFVNPWGRPRWLLLITVLYILWSIVPVAIAIMFAFNNGRSRTTWQGFSTRWFTGATGSVLHDPALQGALKPLKESKEIFERDYLISALQVCEGNVSRAAKMAGKYRADFYDLLKKHNIRPQDYKNND